MAKVVSVERRKCGDLQRQDKIKKEKCFENEERVYALGQFGDRA